jgi:nitrate/nitrite transport system ATP-binding protein
MDEPYRAVDPIVRARLQDELLDLQRRVHKTIVLVTHDVDEAVLLSDRIIMMTNGPKATVGEDLHIDLPRPRNRVTLADNPTYVHYRQDVLKFLYEKQRKLETIAPRRGRQKTEKESEETEAQAARA